MHSVDYISGNSTPGDQNEVIIQLDIYDTENFPEFDVTILDVSEFVVSYTVANIDLALLSGQDETITGVTGEIISFDFNSTETNGTFIDVMRATAEISVSHVYKHSCFFS